MDSGVHVKEYLMLGQTEGTVTSDTTNCERAKNSATSKIMLL